MVRKTRGVVATNAKSMTRQSSRLQEQRLRSVDTEPKTQAATRLSTELAERTKQDETIRKLIQACQRKTSATEKQIEKMRSETQELRDIERNSFQSNRQCLVEKWRKQVTYRAQEFGLKAMQAGSTDDEIAQMVLMPMCGRCGELFDGRVDATIPRLLQCGHSTCQSCLLAIAVMQSVTIGQDPVSKFVCPTCSSNWSIRGTAADLPKNFAVIDFAI